MPIETISVHEMKENCVDCDTLEIIDVRTPMEFSEVRVPQAKNIPLDRFDPDTLTNGDMNAKSQPIYVICKSGARSQMACKKLVASGYECVYNVDGGTQAWDAAGLPVVRSEKKVISLERQVRIIAGGMILTGAVLALVLHPYWAILPGVCGLGLLHAGFTDSCMMGLLLARMPWNQGQADACSVKN